MHKKKFLQGIKPKLSKQPLIATVKKYKSYSSLVKKYDIFFTADDMTFICFRYALNSLLGIK